MSTDKADKLIKELLLLLSEADRLKLHKVLAHKYTRGFKDGLNDGYEQNVCTQKTTY